MFEGELTMIATEIDQEMPNREDMECSKDVS